MGDEAYEQAKNGHNLLAFQGYTMKKINGKDAYKPVIFEKDGTINLKKYGW